MTVRNTDVCSVPSAPLLYIGAAAPNGHLHGEGFPTKTTWAQCPLRLQWPVSLSTLGLTRLIICQKGLSSRAYKDHLSHIRMLSGYGCICHVTFRFHRVQTGHKVIKLTEIQIICAFCTCQTSPIKSLSAGMRSSIPRSLLRHPQMLNSSLQWGMINDHDRRQLSLGLFGTYFDSVQVLTDWRGLHCLWKNKWFQALVRLFPIIITDRYQKRKVKT